MQVPSGWCGAPGTLPGLAGSQHHCPVKLRSRAGCQLPWTDGHSHVQSAQHFIGLMTDRWFPSQCLRLTPSMGSGQTHRCCLGSWPKSSTSGHSPGWAGGGAGAGAGRAVPSSGSSNTRLEKQLFPSALTTAPTRAIPAGRESSPWHNRERAVATRPRGMSHMGPLGVVAPPVPSTGTAEAQGGAGGSSPG